MFQITALYAGLLALLLVALSVRVILYRRANRLSLGDEGDRGLLRLMRTQANCAEYVPISLVLLGLAEAMAPPAFVVHLLGLMLLVGRVLHAYGFGRAAPIMGLRVAGTALTLTMICLTATGLVLHALV